jgi:hypothetical protein
MINKSLFFRYTLLFILISLILVVFIKEYKEKELNLYINNSLNSSKDIFLNYLEQSKKFSNMIFFNHINKNRNIISLYKSSLFKE